MSRVWESTSSVLGTDAPGWRCSVCGEEVDRHEGEEPSASRRVLVFDGDVDGTRALDCREDVVWKVLHE